MVSWLLNNIFIWIQSRHISIYGIHCDGILPVNCIDTDPYKTIIGITLTLYFLTRIYARNKSLWKLKDKKFKFNSSFHFLATNFKHKNIAF